MWKRRVLSRMGKYLQRPCGNNISGDSGNRKIDQYSGNRKIDQYVLGKGKEQKMRLKRKPVSIK